MVLDSLLPVFALILLGLLLKRRRLTNDAFLVTSDRLVYYIFFPALSRGRLLMPHPDATDQNFKIVVEYDGTAYHGWQRQKRDPSIQGALEHALARMTDQTLTVNGSGRTDAGVHALGQVASFRCRTRLGPLELLKGLNSLLPADIAVRACETMPLDFHARFDARWKTYQYRVLNRPVRPALERHRVWHIYRPLDLAAMRAALPHIIGTHDFRAFENTGSPRSTTVRTVRQADLWAAEDGRVCFDVSANGFLKFMVRNLMGTLVAVGLGRLPPQEVQAIRQSGDRRRAGAAAPPEGLYLLHVTY
jgi:tRNA pseudouridine38-40 synthase